MSSQVNVIGAGLAGCEACYQLAKRGIPVRLFEMKPQKMSPAHTSPLFAELVCSNSLRSDRLQNAVGLLKEEMRQVGSLIMEAADGAKVPAGGALAVDRALFSRHITAWIEAEPLIEIVHEEVADIAALEGITIIAAGPLASDALSTSIVALTGKEGLHFFDAAAPIVTRESLDFSKIYEKSRYDRGGADYLNCPMSSEEYAAFYEALVSAECAQMRDFEKHGVFEGCMPVEEMARRGEQTLLFGPLKAVGLRDPRTGRDPHAVVQLRREDAAGSLFNLVGFQTHLKFPEQRRVFRMIPGLENAEFARYGVMHRNTYIDSPRLLDRWYRLRERQNIFFAGQISGVEGYVESAASGLLAGIAAAAMAQERPLPEFSQRTATGALAAYVSAPATGDFQPMNVNFGILEPCGERIRKKAEKYEYLSRRALDEIGNMNL